MLRKIAFTALTCIALRATPQGGAVHVNRVFQDASGSPVFNPILNPFGIQWSKSITNGSGELITVGHTYVSGQGENIFLIKYNNTGGIVFQTDFNTSGTQNDYGTSLTEDGSGNIYVCGTTDNGGSTDYDVIVLKYNSGGTLQNSTIYTGPSGLNDVATDIVNNGGVIFVSVANENTGTGYDYLLLKYNAGLVLQANGTYDYAGLNDIPTGIEYNGSDVFVSGASANNTVDWDYATAKFDASTCAYGTDSRSSISGVGFDQPLAFKKDGSGNIYMTGKATTTLGTTDILTVKISPTFSVLWSVTYDGYGLDDAGTSIAIDGSGNVFVGGFVTNTIGHKELFCLKYNSAGTATWQHQQSGKDSNADSFVKSIGLNTTGSHLYFAGGETGLNGQKHVVVGKLKNNGQRSWERTIEDPTDDILPSDLEIEGDDIFVISALDSTTNSYLTTKYNEMEEDTTREFSNTGKAIFNKNQLIVRFLPIALDSNIIDNSNGSAITEFGTLQNFMKPTAYATLTTALSDACRDCPIKAIKVFPGLTTNYTATTSRLGETIPVPDFWATLLLEFPQSTNVLQIHHLFENLPGIISYSEPNFLVTMPSLAGIAATSANATSTGSNDPMWNQQHNMDYQGVYANAHINLGQAHNVFTYDSTSFTHITGRPYIRGGIFDNGVDYRHRDLGDAFFSLATNDRVVRAGWDILNSVPMISQAIHDNDGHGTACAGIIAATKDNGVGVVGIAGSSGSQKTPFAGVSLYSIKMVASFLTGTNSAVPINGVARGIIESAMASNLPMGYGLNFSNHSWAFHNNNIGGPPPHYTDTNITLITEAVHFANRAQVTQVASRGNTIPTANNLPSCIDDDWMLNVGGTGITGNFIHQANAPVDYGRGVDIAAPASDSLVWTTANNVTVTSVLGSTVNVYRKFWASSAAVPHVSGVVGLLMSYMNHPTGQAHYDNLAPEDCEFIIQASASTPTTPGCVVPNDSIGYGRLNAGGAMKLIEKPYRTLYHFGTNTSSPYTITKSVYSNNDTIRLTERYQNKLGVYFKKGRYIVKTFKIDAVVNHSFNYSIDSIMYYWPRPSSSNLIELFDISNKSLRPRERIVVNSCTSSNASLTGYLYQVRDTSTGAVIGWWPCDTTFNDLLASEKLFEYSILAKNTTLKIRKNNQTNESVTVFPNPTDKFHNIKIENTKPCLIKIDMFDNLGRLVKTIYSGKTEVGMLNLQNSLEGLPKTLYIYKVSLGDEIIYKKCIKN